MLRPAAHEAGGKRQAVARPLDRMQGDRRRWAVFRVDVGPRAVARPLQPPLLQRLLRIITQVSEAVIAQLDRFQKGHHDGLLFGVQRGEAGRIPVRRSKRADQCVHGHRRIIRAPERVGDEPRKIVPPRLHVQVDEPPESEALEIGVGGFVAGRVEGLGFVIAVDGITTAEAQGRRHIGVGPKRLEGRAHDLVGCDGGDLLDGRRARQRRPPPLANPPPKCLPPNVFPGNMPMPTVFPGTLITLEVFPGKVLTPAVFPGNVLALSVFPGKVLALTVLPGKVLVLTLPPRESAPRSLNERGPCPCTTTSTALPPAPSPWPPVPRITSGRPCSAGPRKGSREAIVPPPLWLNGCWIAPSRDWTSRRCSGLCCQTTPLPRAPPAATLSGLTTFIRLTWRAEALCCST